MSNNNEQNLIDFDLEIEFDPSSDNHHPLFDNHDPLSDNHHPPSDNQDQVQKKNNNTITLSLDNNFQIIQNNCINIDDNPFFDIHEGNIIKTSTPDNLCAQKNENTIKIRDIEDNNLNLKSNFCNNNDNNVDSLLYNNISLISFTSKPTVVNTTTSESDDIIPVELNLNKTTEQNNEQEYNNHSISTCTDLVNLEQSPIKSQTDSNISSILSTEAKQTKTINMTNPLKPLSFTVFETSEIFDDSFEDIMSIQPAWIDSGSSDIDSDLEMLKIPILEKLALNDTPLSIPSSNNADDDNDNDNKTKCEEIKDNNKCILNRLEVLKKKIELEKQKQNDKKNVTTLISDLKDIILDCSNEDKKKTANDLLESLETLLNDSTENYSHNKNDDNNNNKNKKCDENIKKNNGFIVPKIIVKQETFDVDKGNKCSTDSNVNENEKVKQNAVSETEVNNQNDASDSSNNNIVIIKGAAQNIVQQIDKILKDQQDIKSSNECNNSLNSNPTFVFVLSGTPNTLIRQTSEIFNRKNILEKDEKHINNDDDNNDGNSTPYRRRSFSLTDITKHTIKNSQNLDNFKTPKRPIIASNDNQKMIKTTPILKNVENNRKKLLHTEDNKAAKITMRRSLNIFSNNNGSSNNIGNDSKKNGFNSKLRIKSNDLYNSQKPSGPIKATVPIIKVAPIMVDQSNGSESGSKQIQQPFTSTPIQSNNNNNLIQNQKRISFNSQNNNNCNSKLKRRSFSPVKNSRSRYSYHPTTKSSNSKPEVINYDSPLSNNKRKSFAETVNKLTPSKMGTQTLRQGKLKGIQQQGNNKENTPNPKKK